MDESVINLLRRAWDALDSFKQTYPENWNEDDERILTDLMRLDLKLSEREAYRSKEREWQDLSEAEINMILGSDIRLEHSGELRFIRAVEAALKAKNS